MYVGEIMTRFAYFPFRIGCNVREKEGRHTGRVEAVVNNVVKVRWHDNDWVTWFEYPHEELTIMQGDATC